MAVQPACAPLLTTERLDLWLPQSGDFAHLAAIVADPRTGRHLGVQASLADHFTRFSRSAGSWLLYGYGAFILRPKGGQEVIGNCGIFHSWRGLGADFDDNPEAGWIIAARHTGHGLAREAMEASLAWFESEHVPRRTICMIAPENAPSLRLAERLGYQPMRDTVLPGGEPIRLFERTPAPG